MHKQLEEDRISGALNKPSAEDEFDSRVRESEVSKRPARAANTSHRYRHSVIETRQRDVSPRERKPTADFVPMGFCTG